MPGTEAFCAEIQRFLTDYGERTGAGYGSNVSILQPTWRERSDLVLKLLRHHLGPGVAAPEAARAVARAARDALVEQLCAACDDPGAVAALRRTLPLARRGAADLENHNHHIDQLSYGQLRRALVAAARHLMARGALDAIDDIFWLQRADIVAALRANAPPDLRRQVTERRAQQAEAANLDPPPVLGLPDPALDPRGELRDDVTLAAEASDPWCLRGVGASSGRRRGRARVVPISALAPDIEPGDILVAENAGPLWTPLFPLLGGIVLDQGAFGQHAATTAREYGVPAVIQTGDATRRLRSGEWVIVDGDAGVIEREEAAAG